MLILINILNEEYIYFQIAAAIFIAVAVKARDNGHGLNLSSATIFPIVLGVIIALIAFFGCCGAVKENSCMLSTVSSYFVKLHTRVYFEQ